MKILILEDSPKSLQLALSISSYREAELTGMSTTEGKALLQGSRYKELFDVIIFGRSSFNWDDLKRYARVIHLSDGFDQRGETPIKKVWVMQDWSYWSSEKYTMDDYQTWKVAVMWALGYGTDEIFNSV